MVSKRAKDRMPVLTSWNYQLATEKNCKVHDARPAACSGYRCAWLEGHGAPEDRPDKTGILFDNVAPSTLLEGGLLAKPLWLGAEKEDAARQAIENVSSSADVPVLVLEFTEKRLLRIVGRGVA